MKKFLSISLLLAVAFIFGTAQMKAQSPIYKIIMDNEIEVVPGGTVTVDVILSPLPILGTLVTWDVDVKGALANKISAEFIAESQGPSQLSVTVDNLSAAELADLRNTQLEVQAEIAGIPVPIKAEAKLVGFPF